LILDPLDLGVEALGAGVGDSKAQVGDDVLEMSLEGPLCLRDGRNVRTYGPVIPRTKVAASDRLAGVMPEVANVLLDRPCAANGPELFTQGGTGRSGADVAVQLGNVGVAMWRHQGLLGGRFSPRTTSEDQPKD
jgi:hypothetical protein